MPPTLLDLAESAAGLTGSLVWAVLAGVGLAWAWRRVRARARHDLRGRWVAVTGSDSGLGRGLVEVLVDRGAHVVALCLTEEGAEAARQRGVAAAVAADLGSPEGIATAARTVEEASSGALWALVHSAGIAQPGFVEYLPLPVWRDTMEVNFFAPVAVTQRLLPLLRQAGGRVVLVSSVDGLVSLPGNAAYDASKFALEAFADALRAELSLWGMPVSVVNPATLRTPLALRFFEGHRASWTAAQAADPEGSWKAHWPARWLEAFIATNSRRLEQIAQDPAHAIRDMEHAVSARRPQMRYLSGTLAKTFFRLLWWGPESWALRVKRAMITPRPPGAQR